MENLNYEFMYGSFGTIINIVGWLFGIIVLMIVVYVSLVTSIDIVYITVPIFRGRLKKMYDGRTLGGLKFISADVIESVDESYTSGQSPLLIYLKKRIVTYIFMAITLAILMTGGDGILDFVSNIVYRLMRAANII